MSGQQLPTEPDGYVALPQPRAREIVTVRCVVCGKDDERPENSIRYTADVLRDDDGHAATVTRKAGPRSGGLWWPDGALVGACDAHTDDEKVTALRLRGAEPFGFLTEQP